MRVPKVNLITVFFILEYKLTREVLSASSPCKGVGKCGKPETNKTYIHCGAEGYHPYDQKCCMAGEPRELNYTIVKFDIRKLTFEVVLNWIDPLYGLEHLWGYEVHYSILNSGHALIRSCVQILHKTNQIKLQDLKPGEEYEFVVLSLPRYDFRTSNSVSRKVRMPDLCSTQKKQNISLSLKCLSTPLVKKEENCLNGSLKVAWKGLYKNEFNVYLLEWKNAKKKKYNFYELLNKDITQHTITGLSPTEEYDIQLTLWKGLGHWSKPSNRLRFSCISPPENFTVFKLCTEEKAKITWSRPPHGSFDSYILEWKKQEDETWDTLVLEKDKTEHVMTNLIQGSHYDIQIAMLRNGSRSINATRGEYYCQVKKRDAKFIIISIVVSIAFVSMLVVAAILCRLRNKLWKQHFQPSLDPVERRDYKPEDMSKTKVLVIHLPGCKFVERVCIHFVDLLCEAGIQAVSYEQESIQVHDMTSAMYLHKKLEEVDFVVTFFSEPNDDTDKQTAKLYRQAVKICSNEMEEPELKRKNISFYFHLRNGSEMFGDYSVDTYRNVPATLKHSSYKCPKDVPKVVERILHPAKSRIWPESAGNSLDKSLLTKIETYSIATVSESHEFCFKDECKKGVRVYKYPNRPISKEQMKDDDSKSINSLYEYYNSNNKDPNMENCNQSNETDEHESSGFGDMDENISSGSSKKSSDSDHNYIWIPRRSSYDRLISETSISSTNSTCNGIVFKGADSEHAVNNLTANSGKESASKIPKYRRLISTSSDITQESV